MDKNKNDQTKNEKKSILKNKIVIAGIGVLTVGLVGVGGYFGYKYLTKVSVMDFKDQTKTSYQDVKDQVSDAESKTDGLFEINKERQEGELEQESEASIKALNELNQKIEVGRSDIPKNLSDDAKKKEEKLNAYYDEAGEFSRDYQIVASYLKEFIDSGNKIRELFDQWGENIVSKRDDFDDYDKTIEATQDVKDQLDELYKKHAAFSSHEKIDQLHTKQKEYVQETADLFLAWTEAFILEKQSLVELSGPMYSQSQEDSKNAYLKYSEISSRIDEEKNNILNGMIEAYNSSLMSLHDQEDELDEYYSGANAIEQSKDDEDKTGADENKDDKPTGLENEPYLEMELLDYPDEVKDNCTVIEFKVKAKNIGDKVISYEDIIGKTYFFSMRMEIEGEGYRFGSTEQDSEVSNFESIEPGQEKVFTYRPMRFERGDNDEILGDGDDKYYFNGMDSQLDVEDGNQNLVVKFIFNKRTGERTVASLGNTEPISIFFNVVYEDEYGYPRFRNCYQ